MIGVNIPFVRFWPRGYTGKNPQFNRWILQNLQSLGIYKLFVDMQSYLKIDRICLESVNIYTDRLTLYDNSRISYFSRMYLGLNNLNPYDITFTNGLNFFYIWVRKSLKFDSIRIKHLNWPARRLNVCSNFWSHSHIEFIVCSMYGTKIRRKYEFKTSLFSQLPVVKM